MVCIDNAQEEARRGHEAGERRYNRGWLVAQGASRGKGLRQQDGIEDMYNADETEEGAFGDENDAMWVVSEGDDDDGGDDGDEPGGGFSWNLPSLSIQ